MQTSFQIEEDASSTSIGISGLLPPPAPFGSRRGRCHLDLVVFAAFEPLMYELTYR